MSSSNGEMEISQDIMTRKYSWVSSQCSKLLPYIEYMLDWVLSDYMLEAHEKFKV